MNRFGINISLDRIIRLFTCLYFFFTIFFPTSHNLLKFVPFSLLFVLALYKNKGKVSIPKPVIAFVLYNVIASIIGVLNGAPGALRVTTVTIIYPIVFSIAFISLYDNEDFYFFISRIILLSATTVSIYDIVFVVSQFFNIELPSILNIAELDMSYGNYFGYTHFTTTHINVLFFSVPFSISLLINYNKCSGSKYIISKPYLVISIVVQLLCTVLATRVALLLLAIISVLIVLLINFKVYKQKLHIDTSKIAFYLFVAVVIAFVIYLNREYLGKVFDMSFNKLLNETGTSSTSIRSIQSQALINGWLESPFWGHGAGSYLPDLIREPDMPWAYELTYHALLFQNGILGLFFTLFLYSTIIHNIISTAIIRKSLSNLSISIIVALISFLIANAVDPYLAKFGYMWVVYMPLSFGIYMKNSINNDDALLYQKNKNEN